MMRKLAMVLGLITVIFCMHKRADAQYPEVPQAVQHAANSMLKAEEARVNRIWEQNISVIEKNKREGKPYIPFAHRPTDLPQAKIPAFPGAEGGGMYTFGGRGGKVYVVTTLADSGPGSFRAACEAVGPRIVVFNVAGIIHLKTPIIVKAPYISIEGQSAPGDGICVAGESFWINTHDVIIRYMRFRRGATNVGRRDDAVGGNPVGNIMIDHVSSSWGLDENMSIYRHMYDPQDGSKRKKFPTVNVTIQNSIFSEGLDTYNHSFGSTLGGENCSFMRNLWADNTARNPSIGWNGIFNFVNNVIFNWHHRSIDGGDYTALYNIINNYFKPGPVTPKNEPISYRILKPESGRSNLPYVVFGRAYVHGNIVDGNERITKNNWGGGVQMEGKDGNLMSFEESKKYFPDMKVDRPFPMPPLKIISAEQAYHYVLNNAGATLPYRDSVDKRVIRQVRTGKIDYLPNINTDTMYQFKYRRLSRDSYKKGIITNVSEVGGYPDYTGTPYKDSDKDGMPDEWENKFGLDPHDASDTSKDNDGDIYTNIEEFLNGTDPKSYIDYTNPYNNYDTLIGKTDTNQLKGSIDKHIEKGF